MGAPQNVRISEGKRPGALLVSCDPIAGASSYLYQHLEGADPLSGAWEFATVTQKSSVTLHDLISGTRQWVRVAAIGAAGQGPWSQPMNKIVP